MASVTSAEALLDTRARKIMKKDPTVGYASACSRVLMEDPSLYQKYEQELAAGRTYTVPEVRYDTPFGQPDDEVDEADAF